MIEVTAFEVADLEGLAGQAHEATALASLGGWRKMAETVAAAGPAWTVRCHGRVIACGGLGIIWNGRAEVWSFIDQDMPKTWWPALHRATVKMLREAEARFGLHRVEASCVAGWKPGARWLGMLGFEFEGPMRAYSPDKRDYLRFARVAA